jgi:hypothetical protein
MTRFSCAVGLLTRQRTKIAAVARSQRNDQALFGGDDFAGEDALGFGNGESAI